MTWLRGALVIGIACFFAAMWGIVLREKLAPPPGSNVRPNYDSILKPDEKRRESAMGIYFGDKRLGSTTTVIERTEEGQITLQSSTQVDFADLPRYIIPKAGGWLDCDFGADISPLLGLQTLRVTSRALGLRLYGTVRENTLVIRGTMGDQPFATDVPYAGDPFLGEAFSPTAGLPDLKRARPGDTWTLHMVNPLLGSVEKVQVETSGSFDVEVEGERVRVHRLVFNVGSRVWRSWVTEDGDVLVQGTPFGLTLRREDLAPEMDAALARELPGLHGNVRPH